MKFDNFRTNFLILEKKLTKQPKKKKQKNLWLFLCLALAAILVGASVWGLFNVYKKPAIPTLTSDKVFYAQFNLDLKTKAGKGFNLWAAQEASRLGFLSQLLGRINLDYNQATQKFLAEIFNNRFFVLGLKLEGQTRYILGGNFSKKAEAKQLLAKIAGESTVLGSKTFKKVRSGNDLGLIDQDFYYLSQQNYLFFSRDLKALSWLASQNIKEVLPQQLFGRWLESSFLAIDSQPAVLKAILAPFSQQFSSQGPVSLKFFAQSDELVLEREANDKPKEAGLDTVFWSQFVLPRVSLVFLSRDLSLLSENQNLAPVLANWEKVYGFNISQDFKPFLSRNGLVLVRSPRDEIDLSGPGVQYLLFLAKSQGPGQPQDKFQELAKEILAQKLPQEKITRLPDSTTITEFVGNPDALVFETKKVANFNVNYLKNETIGFEFANADLGMVNAYSNSLTFLEEVLSYYESQPIYQNYDFLGLVKTCFEQERGLIAGPNMFYLDFGSEFFKETGIRRILANDQRFCAY